MECGQRTSNTVLRPVPNDTSIKVLFVLIQQDQKIIFISESFLVLDNKLNRIEYELFSMASQQSAQHYTNFRYCVWKIKKSFLNCLLKEPVIMFHGWTSLLFFCPMRHGSKPRGLQSGTPGSLWESPLIISVATMRATDMCAQLIKNQRT